MENGHDFTNICLNGPKTPKNIRQTDFLNVSEQLQNNFRLNLENLVFLDQILSIIYETAKN